MVPDKVKELNVDGAEIRPIPGYEGMYISRTGTVFSIRKPYSFQTHPKFAHVFDAGNGITASGKHTIYRRQALYLAFKD